MPVNCDLGVGEGGREKRGRGGGADCRNEAEVESV